MTSSTRLGLFGLCLALTACSDKSTTEVDPNTTPNPGDTAEEDAGGTDDGGADDGGADDGGAEDGGTEDGGTEDGGTEDGGTEDGGTEDGGAEDGGTEDGGDDGPTGGDHELDGMWETDIAITATIDRADGGTSEGSCTANLQFLMTYPTAASTLTCDFGSFGDASFSSCDFELTVADDDTTVSGLFNSGPLEMELTGTLDGTEMDLSFSGSGSSGSGSTLFMDGTATAAQLPPAE
jgi:hypothetical protein